MSEFRNLGNVRTEVEGLIAKTRTDDPSLYQAIYLLNQQVDSISQELSPIVAASVATASGTPTTGAPVGFTAVSTGKTIRFTWNSVSGAVQYEVRRGASWDTASFLFRTSSLQGDIDPELYGTYTYLIKSLDASSIYSTSSASTIFAVPQIAAPIITGQVIDNNVLLNWTIPISTFDIDHYIVKRNSVQVGIIFSTFTILFEVVSGIYIYSVQAVDIAGNIGTAGTISVNVNQPPDYVLSDTRISALGGTKVNVLLESNHLVCCANVTETFAAHFTTHSWGAPQDQIDAGYPIYIQPVPTTGSYEEVIDYGLVLNNTIVTVNYNTIIITPASAVTVVIKMAVSLDNISYSAFTSGSAQFFPTFRYLKFKLEFTGADDKAIILVSNVAISISTKRELDSGEIVAASTDALGTEVFFNKAFKDIDSITVSVKSTTEPFYAIYRFVDIPNPVSFFTYVFDTVGARLTKTVSWKARGIV